MRDDLEEGVLPTRSHNVIPLLRAVSASMKFSVSSYSTPAYRSRMFASIRGGNLTFFKAVSKHPSPVAISFSYAFTSVAAMERAIEDASLCAASKNSSARDIRRFGWSTWTLAVCMGAILTDVFDVVFRG